MDTRTRNKMTEFLFNAGMWWRIAYGVIRIVVASLLLHHIGTPLSDIFIDVVERVPSYHTPVHLVQAIDQIHFVVTYYLAFYFLFWGALDIFLSVMLLQHQLWAFPISIYLIVIFIGYELFRFTHTHSKLLLAVIFMDVCIILIIQREYRKLQTATIEELARR